LSDWPSILAGVSAVAATVTAGGVAFGVRQVKLSTEQLELVKTQTQVDFEDGLSREYRSIVRDIPARAFIEQAEAVTDEDLNAFFRYFDLSNEQLFLARRGRVSEPTAADWKDGILANAARPMFGTAWSSFAEGLPDDYWEDLRAMLGPNRSSP